jgi:hypothetical protein
MDVRPSHSRHPLYPFSSSTYSIPLSLHHTFSTRLDSVIISSPLWVSNPGSLRKPGIVTRVFPTYSSGDLRQVLPAERIAYHRRSQAAIHSSTTQNRCKTRPRRIHGTRFESGSPATRRKNRLPFGTGGLDRVPRIKKYAFQPASHCRHGLYSLHRRMSLFII